MHMVIPQGKLVLCQKQFPYAVDVFLRTAIFAWVLLDLASVVALLGLKIVLHQIIKIVPDADESSK